MEYPSEESRYLSPSNAMEKDPDQSIYYSDSSAMEKRPGAEIFASSVDSVTLLTVVNEAGDAVPTARLRITCGTLTKEDLVPTPAEIMNQRVTDRVLAVSIVFANSPLKKEISLYEFGEKIHAKYGYFRGIEDLPCVNERTKRVQRVDFEEMFDNFWPIRQEPHWFNDSSVKHPSKPLFGGMKLSEISALHRQPWWCGMIDGDTFARMVNEKAGRRAVFVRFSGKLDLVKDTDGQRGFVIGYRKGGDAASWRFSRQNGMIASTERGTTVYYRTIEKLAHQLAKEKGIPLAEDKVLTDYGIKLIVLPKGCRITTTSL